MNRPFYALNTNLIDESAKRFSQSNLNGQNVLITQDQQRQIQDILKTTVTPYTGGDSYNYHYGYVPQYPAQFPLRAEKRSVPGGVVFTFGGFQQQPAGLCAPQVAPQAYAPYNIVPQQSQYPLQQLMNSNQQFMGFGQQYMGPGPQQQQQFSNWKPATLQDQMTALELQRYGMDPLLYLQYIQSRPSPFTFHRDQMTYTDPEASRAARAVPSYFPTAMEADDRPVTCNCPTYGNFPPPPDKLGPDAKRLVIHSNPHLNDSYDDFDLFAGASSSTNSCQTGATFGGPPLCCNKRVQFARSATSIQATNTEPLEGKMSEQATNTDPEGANGQNGQGENGPKGENGQGQDSSQGQNGQGQNGEKKRCPTMGTQCACSKNSRCEKKIKKRGGNKSPVNDGSQWEYDDAKDDSGSGSEGYDSTGTADDTR